MIYVTVYLAAGLAIAILYQTTPARAQRIFDQVRSEIPKELNQEVSDNLIMNLFLALVVLGWLPILIVVAVLTIAALVRRK